MDLDFDLGYRITTDKTHTKTSDERTDTMAALSADERLALINENLAESLNPEIIEKIVREGGNPKIYWGTLTRWTPKDRDEEK